MPRSPTWPGRRKLADLVGGSFQILDRAGHLAPLEAPNAVARAIEEMAARVAG